MSLPYPTPDSEPSAMNSSDDEAGAFPSTVWVHTEYDHAMDGLKAKGPRLVETDTSNKMLDKAVNPVVPSSMHIVTTRLPPNFPVIRMASPSTPLSAASNASGPHKKGRGAFLPYCPWYGTTS